MGVRIQTLKERGYKFRTIQQIQLGSFSYQLGDL